MSDIETAKASSREINDMIRRKAGRGVFTTEAAPQLSPASAWVGRQLREATGLEAPAPAMSDLARRTRDWAVEHVGTRAIRNPVEVVARLDLNWETLPGRTEIDEALSALHQQDPAAVQVTSGGGGARPQEIPKPPPETLMNDFLRLHSSQDGVRAEARARLREARYRH